MKHKISKLFVLVSSFLLTGCGKIPGDVTPTPTVTPTVTPTPSVTPTEQPVDVESVSLNETNLNLFIGDSFRLEATILPLDASNKEVTWSSSSSSIARVTDGLVEALSEGKAVVSVTTVDGHKTASCQVIVSKKDTDIHVESVSLNKSSLDLKVGDEETLDVSILPENATNKQVSWKSTDESIVSVSDGKLTAKDVGEAIILVTSVDGNKTDSCSVSVQAKENYWDLITSIDELVDGDIVTFGSKSQSALAGEYTTATNTNYLKSVTASYSSIENGFLEVDGLIPLTVHENGEYWTFETENGLLGASAARKLAFDSNTNWKISIDSEGQATIANQNTSIGKILYNAGVSTKRFSTYIDNVSSKKLLPEIYRGKCADPIYAKSISINGNSEVNINETITLSVSFTPATTNQRKVTWSSSDESIATVNNGVVTGLKEGDVNITASVQGESGVLTTSHKVTVNRVAVTSVSLDVTSKEIATGHTLTLTETVLPANATNKDVIWSSSDETVASVDNGVVTGLKAGTAVITVTTVDGKKTATCDLTVSDIVLDTWTIMLYICGADLESQGGYATDDIEEILSVKNQPDDVNIIIQTGGARSWSYSDISASYLQRWHVENQSLVKDAQLTKASMGKSSTFQSFIEWGIEEYPAEKTGVILWNHGGALDGCCFDENYGNDSLTNSEVYTALGDAFKNTGRTENLEWIGYDCCLMQEQDIAEFNSHYFNYMIASQEAEIGEGWNYTDWIDDLYATDDTEKLLTAICDSFIAYCDEQYGATNNDQTLSWLDLSYAQEYLEAFESFASDARSIINNNRTKFHTIMNSVKCYADEYMTYSDYQTYVSYYGYPSSWFEQISQSYYVLHGYNFYGTFDVYDAFIKMKQDSIFASVIDSIDNVLSVYRDFLGYSNVGNGAGESHGLCLVCKMNDYYPDYFASETNFSTWRSIVG